MFAEPLRRSASWFAHVLIAIVFACGSTTAAERVMAAESAVSPADGKSIDGLPPTVDLLLYLHDTVETVLPGGQANYSVSVHNNGPADAIGARVVDQLPASLSCTWTCQGFNGGTCTSAGNGSIDDLANLPFGADVIYALSCTVANSATGVITNIARVTAPATVFEPSIANNSGYDMNTVGVASDLAITLTDGVTQVAPGSTTTYTVVASNAGPNTVLGARVQQVSNACASSTWTCSAGGGANCPASGASPIDAYVDLPVGATATFLLQCAISPSATNGTSIFNGVVLYEPRGIVDTVPGNNWANDTNTVSTTIGGAVVTATKTVGGTFNVGGNVVYTITMDNAGNPQVDTPGDELVDVLPPQLQLVSATASSGTAAANLATNTVRWNGAMAAGGRVTVTITAAIVAGASGEIRNQGSVAFDGNGDGVNDSVILTDDPTIGGTADATVFRLAGTGAATGIPSLTPAGLVLLTLSLAFVAMRRSRRRA